MKRLIVLALVLVMAGSVSAAVYDLDIQALPIGNWLDAAGVPNGSQPPGWIFQADWDHVTYPGSAGVKDFQDLGGGVWGKAIELQATDAGNGVIELDLDAFGIDRQDDVLSIEMRYKLINGLPNGGPRAGMSFAGSNAESNISFYHKATYWGQSEVGMLNNNDDVRFWSPPWGIYTAWSTDEDWLWDLPDNDWLTVKMTIDGIAGAVTFTVDGVDHVYNDFRKDFGLGDQVNLADPALYGRGIIRLTTNGTMQISDITVVSTPEPATIALLGMGAIAILRKRR